MESVGHLSTTFATWKPNSPRGTKASFDRRCEWRLSAGPKPLYRHVRRRRKSRSYRPKVLYTKRKKNRYVFVKPIRPCVKTAFPYFPAHTLYMYKVNRLLFVLFYTFWHGVVTTRVQLRRRMFSLHCSRCFCFRTGDACDNATVTGTRYQIRERRLEGTG